MQRVSVRCKAFQNHTRIEFGTFHSYSTAMHSAIVKEEPHHITSTMHAAEMTAFSVPERYTSFCVQFGSAEHHKTSFPREPSTANVSFTFDPGFSVNRNKLWIDSFQLATRRWNKPLYCEVSDRWCCRECCLLFLRPALSFLDYHHTVVGYPRPIVDYRVRSHVKIVTRSR